MRKNIQSIIPKPYAYLHSMQKTSAMFQNNRWKTVRGVEPTRYPLSIHFDSISYRKKTKFTKQKKWEKKIIKGKVRKIFDFCNIVWGNSCESNKMKFLGCKSVHVELSWIIKLKILMRPWVLWKFYPYMIVYSLEKRSSCLRYIMV